MVCFPVFPNLSVLTDIQSTSQKKTASNALLLATTLFNNKIAINMIYQDSLILHLIHVILTLKSCSSVWRGNKTQVHTIVIIGWLWFILGLICQLSRSLNGLVFSLPVSKPVFWLLFKQPKISGSSVFWQQINSIKITSDKEKDKGTRLISVGSSYVWHKAKPGMCFRLYFEGTDLVSV